VPVPTGVVPLIVVVQVVPTHVVAPADAEGSCFSEAHPANAMSAAIMSPCVFISTTFSLLVSL